jgi:Domain of unknown function (DUF4328)/Protein of unknown function (DUF2510)
VSDDVSGYPGAPPGWYADPAGGPGQRWWDGYAWTETTVLPEVPPPPPVLPPPPPGPPGPTSYQVPPPPSYPGVYPRFVPAPINAGDLVQRELALTKTARIAVIIFGLNNLSDLLGLQINRSAFRALGHHLRVAYDASSQGQPVPSFSTPSTTDPLEAIIALAAAVALVFALIWQFRAATAAKALGYPAKRSPGWGVGFWFIPIVNFWMPYQAVRDCLAPDDPRRSLVLRWWLLWIATQLLTTAATAAALASSHVALGISLVAAMFVLAFIAAGRRVVADISLAHQEAVADPRGM